MTALVRQSLPVESERALTRWLGGTSPHTRRAYLHDVTEWPPCKRCGLSPWHYYHGPGPAEHQYETP